MGETTEIPPETLTTLTEGDATRMEGTTLTTLTNGTTQMEGTLITLTEGTALTAVKPIMDPGARPTQPRPTTEQRTTQTQPGVLIRTALKV